MTTQTAPLTKAMIEGLAILKEKKVLAWETGNSTWVNRSTLDALVKRGFATIEVSGYNRPGFQSGNDWVSGGYHSVRIYKAA